jgi:DNA polymerase-3 subunit alpha (Gram-positive type)
MINGKEVVKQKMKEIEMQGNQAANKDKDMYDDLELVLEMYERGFKFLPIDLHKSHATNFLIEDDSLRPPLNSISGMGNVAAEGIFNAVKEGGPFSSIDDLKTRAKVGNSTIDSLRKLGCLRGLPESNQMSFFDML